MLGLLSSDFSQLVSSGEVSTSWLRTSFGAFAARLLLRPALLIFLNPTRLTPLLKRAPQSSQNEAFANTFIPFQTGKHQFLALLALVRSGSALARSVLSLSGASSAHVSAVAVGDALGDAAELLLLSRRYGGGPRRLALVADAVAALFYARVLLLKKDARFAGTVQQSTALTSVPPVWLFAFARLQRSSRISAVFLLAVIGCFVLPKLWREFNRETPSESSQTESADRKLNRAIAIGLIGFFGLKGVASVAVLFGGNE